MRQKELHRWHLMEMVKGGKIPSKEESKKIGLSWRQAKRIRRGIPGEIFRFLHD